MDIDVSSVPGSDAEVAIDSQPAAACTVVLVSGGGVNQFPVGSSYTKVGTAPAAAAPAVITSFHIHFYARPWSLSIDAKAGGPNQSFVTTSANEGLPDAVLATPDYLQLNVRFR